MLPDRLKELFLLSESRGREAAGIAIVRAGSITVLKEPQAASIMMARPAYKELMASLVSSNGEPVLAIGHSRLVTNGRDTISENNQPVVCETLVGIHNGIIVNEAALTAEYGLKRNAEVDTEAFTALVEHFRRDGADFPGAVAQAFKAIEGTASVALVSASDRRLVLGTNNGSLYVSSEPAGDPSFVFTSEAYFLETFFAKLDARTPSVPRRIEPVKPGEVWVVDCETGSAKKADVGTTQNNVVSDNPAVASRKIINLADRLDPRKAALKRCTRCIMPETMPFIAFDGDGVCNYCRTYKKHQPLGIEALREHVAPFRAANGAPDCVVAVSGGRDSCYGLHVLKKELGLNPVAYTYDWGMITDLARRNQARLCGKLGIEHIIVSADIRKKREFIRKNVTAWLRRPILGMIPLFMAGDKQYFYYAEQTRKRLGLHLSFLCENSLERAHFKSGFMGVDEGHNRVFDIGVMNKLKLIAYYGREYMMNPRYLNASLLDTAGAFYSSYFLNHPQVQLFNYAPWVEQELVQVLRGEYDWELDPETTSTWRIGDGTAAFYNYIYYTVAGFTENDALRSNQIREGVLDRPTALSLAARENEPRWDAMRWYANTIGFSLNDALQAINGMPRLFDRVRELGREDVPAVA